MKQCSYCKNLQELNNFYPYTKKDGSKGKRGICITCDKSRAAIWLSKQDNDYIRNNQLKVHYDITLEEYNKLFTLQEGKCQICKTHQKDLTKRLAVDHCHKTSKIRGLLCNNCNRGLGMLKENLDILEAAKEYLAKSQ